MIHVRRDEQGQIVSASIRPDPEHPESLQRMDPAMLRFVRELSGEGELDGSDLPLVRVIEDLVDLLIAGDLIRFTDLPEAAQEKLTKRRSLRDSRRALDLLPDSGDVL